MTHVNMVTPDQYLAGCLTRYAAARNMFTILANNPLPLSEMSFQEVLLKVEDQPKDEQQARMKLKHLLALVDNPLMVEQMDKIRTLNPEWDVVLMVGGVQGRQGPVELDQLAAAQAETPQLNQDVTYGLWLRARPKAFVPPKEVDEAEAAA